MSARSPETPIFNTVMTEIKELIKDINSAKEANHVDRDSLVSFEKRAYDLGKTLYEEAQKETADQTATSTMREQMKTVRFQLTGLRNQYQENQKQKLMSSICSTTPGGAEMDYITNLRHIRVFLETEVNRSEASIRTFKQSTNVLRSTIEAHSSISSLLETGKGKLKSYFRCLSLDDKAIFVASAVYFAVLLLMFVLHFGVFKLIRLLIWFAKWLLKGKKEPEQEMVAQNTTQGQMQANQTSDI